MLEHASMFGLLDPHSLKTMLILCWLRLPKCVENYISDQLCRALLKVHSHCLFTGVLHVLLCLWIPSSNVLPCPLFIERGGICFNSLTKCLSIVSNTSACLTLFNSLTKVREQMHCHCNILQSLRHEMCRTWWRTTRRTMKAEISRREIHAWDAPKMPFEIFWISSNEAFKAAKMRQIGESMCGNLLWFHAERILLAFVPCLPWLSRGRMTQNDSEWLLWKRLMNSRRADPGRIPGVVEPGRVKSIQIAHCFRWNMMKHDETWQWGMHTSGHHRYDLIGQ